MCCNRLWQIEIGGTQPGVRRYKFDMKRIAFLSLFFSLLFVPIGAHACGGFFCRIFPINQVSERILFVVGEGEVTTHVQIQYAGKASDFAWILPMPSVPELTVSHNEIFRQLQFATQPNFLLEWEENECNIFFPEVMTLDGTDSRGEVDVVSEDRVGPYETAVITSDDPEAIATWLLDNGYNLDALGSELLAPYVEAGAYFVVLRLAPGRELGDLQPLALTYPADNPGIPIRLTAVAAEPDMGVLVWVLGSHRAIPKNYLHVQINEARIDWFRGGSNYAQVVTEAANEAGGQAFATDYAGSSEMMQGRFYEEGRFDLDVLRGLKDPVDFLDELFRQGFPRDAQTQALIRRHIPIPTAVLEQGVLQVVFRGDEEAYARAEADGTLQGIAEQSFYNNMELYREWITDLVFDQMAFADELDEVIVVPLRDAEDLVRDFSYLTRLYTTLSADEMTVDPSFSFNPELPDVSNTHTANARFECADPSKPEDVVLVVTLRDGREIRSRPFANGRPDGPILFRSAATIEQLAESGPPEWIGGLTARTPDFDGDGEVEFKDFTMFAVAFGKKDPQFDLTGDGLVNFSDFLIFAQSYGNKVT